MNKKYIKQNLGFTLAELLVVMAILSLLMLLSFLATKTQIFKGFDARRKTDLAQIKIGLEEYEKDHNCYPLSFSCKGDNAYDLQPYMPMIPCDPRTKESYIYRPGVTDPNTKCASWYWLFTVLENKNDPKIDDLDCTYGCGPTGYTVYNYYISSPNAPKPESGSSSGTPSPTQTESSGYYGCFNRDCLPIGWDTTIPGPECGPNYVREDCYGLCKDLETLLPINECN